MPFVDRAAGRTMHLIFLAHLWACAPFMAVWVVMPEVRRHIEPLSLHRIQWFLPVVAVYIVVRTFLAFKDPRWLNWMVVYPPFDVAIVSILVWLGNRDPLSNVTLLYMFPLAESAASLSIPWAISAGAMVLAGAGIATGGFTTDDPFNTAFRYFFLFILATLVAWLSRTAANLREQLGVARDRNRIAMEMHDGVQGHLVTLSSQLELVGRLAAVNPDRAAEVAGEARAGTTLAADELRFLVQRLRAPSLAEGFLPALRAFATNQTSRNELDLEFDVQGEPLAMGPETENALFRIAQEALNNVLRHASARAVRIALCYGLDAVALSVQDDGTGFDVSADPGSGRSGIDGMRTRAQAAGAVFQIESAKGRGTMVTVTVPLPTAGRHGRKPHA
jgi:signal transduction histidine kinase